MRDRVFRPRASTETYAELLAQQLASSEVFGWGAFAAETDNAELLGYLTAEIREASREWEQDAILYILDVDVALTLRGRGIAKSLLRLALAKAATMNIARAELSWIANDPRSAAVWMRLGFQPYLTRGWIAVDPVDGTQP